MFHTSFYHCIDHSKRTVGQSFFKTGEQLVIRFLRDHSHRRIFPVWKDITIQIIFIFIISRRFTAFPFLFQPFIRGCLEQELLLFGCRDHKTDCFLKIFLCQADFAISGCVQIFILWLSVCLFSNHHARFPATIPALINIGSDSHRLPPAILTILLTADNR